MIDGLPLAGVILCVIVISWYRTLCFIILRLLRSRMNAAAHWFQRRRVPAWVDLLNLGISLTALSALWYAHFIEPYRPEVVTVEIESKKLATLSEPLRIVQLSDLHCDPTVRLEGELPRIVAELKPDLIAFTGDAINSRAGLPVFQVEVLNGRAVAVSVKGAEIWLAGSAVDREGELVPAIKTIPEGRFALALHHFPGLFKHAAGAGADLLLAGDTHGGGQIRLPLVGELIRIRRHHPYDTYYTAGLHRQGASQLYVSRGIGMEGGHVPRVRFGCRPEVTLFLLNPPGTKGQSKPQPR
ncbi:MAG: metallophosphoesterase [Planctomycetota bacterium]